MNKFKSMTNLLTWFISLMLLAFVAGCGSSSSSSVAGDVTAPTVTSVAPLNGVSGVATNTNVTANFSEAIDPATITVSTFTLATSAVSPVPVSGVVSYVGNTAKFNPASDVAATTSYTATITTGAKDLAGNALAAAKIWSFTTGATTDVIAPTVSSTDPASGVAGMPINANITATFNEGMDATTFTSSTFTLTDVTNGNMTVPGAVTAAGKNATFNPTSNLAASAVHTATIIGGASGVMDLSGNALASNYSWNFTTGSAVAAAQAPVVLGGAGSFAILTKSGVTNVHTSAITGNIGSSPITSAAMDNVFCSEITGFIYGADAAYTGNGTVTCFKGLAADITLVGNAVLDMMTAYTDAAGRTLPDHTELGAGDISGMTLAPGLYKWGTGVLINADVTLNGSAADVWIFQIAGDLTQATATNVILTGGALPKNVFWQVGGGTGVAIGTGAHMEGVILAAKAITVTTGASVKGRLLAQTAVTLQQNAITEPAP